MLASKLHNNWHKCQVTNQGARIRFSSNSIMPYKRCRTGQVCGLDNRPRTFFNTLRKDSNNTTRLEPFVLVVSAMEKGIV